MGIYFGGVYGARPTLISGGSSGYVRPSDWLTLPTVEATDQVFYGLYAVFDNESNFATVTATGAYTVDWGDGSTPVNFASGTTAYYNYDYNAAGLGALTTRGYKQAIVTITPQAGQTLSNINLLVKHNQTGLVDTTDSQWLDIRLAMNNAGIVTMYNANWQHKYLEQFEWVGSNSQTNFSSMLRNCYSLQSIPQLDTSSGTNFNAMFYNCYSLRSISQLDTSSGTNFGYMFDGCRSLQSIPQLNTSSGTFFGAMFQGCFSLQSIPQLNISSGTNFSNMFQGCTSLQSIPQLNTSSGTNFNAMFVNCSSLQSIPQLDTSSGISFISMFQGCVSISRIQATFPNNQNFTITNCSLGPNELNELYTNLPLGGTSTITVTGNWGVNEPSYDPTIATAKGYTIVT